MRDGQIDVFLTVEAKVPSKKFAEYEKTGFNCAIDVPSATRKWSKKAVNDKEEGLLGFARKEWGD